MDRIGSVHFLLESLLVWVGMIARLKWIKVAKYEAWCHSKQVEDPSKVVSNN